MTVIAVTNSADQGEGTLRQAVLDAQSGDTIEFDSGLSNQTITLDSGLELNKSLTFDGADAPGVEVSGGDRTNIFWLGGVDENLNLTVKNLTLANSYYEAEAGGAIWAQENSTIEIENVNFNDNVSDGGAIHALQGSVITVNNSNFDGNDGASISDKEYGTGAISLFALGKLDVKDSTFTNNKGFNGGAIHVTSSDLYVENSTFIGNDSTPGKDRVNFIPGAGGAIYADAASVPNDEKFYGSSPQHVLQGETEGGVISINNSHFEQNKASGQGGALALWGYSQDQVVVTNNTIIDNEVTLNKDNMAQGGGVWLMGYGTVENNTIANNRSQDKGGGLFIWGEVPTTVSNTTFSGNQAAKGGAIYSDIWDTELKIDNVDFDSNSASVEGGVLYTNEIRPVYIESSQFSNNTAAGVADDSLSNVASNVVNDTTNSDRGLANAPVVEEIIDDALVEANPYADYEVITDTPIDLEEAGISSGLELNQDSLFSDRPQYTPSQENGLMVWNTNDVWHMEATGKTEASRFEGRIVAENPIEDLSFFELENNDKVEFADESHQVVEFKLIVGQESTDGISFKVPDSGSVFLELEQDEAISVKAGSAMEEINGFEM